MSMAKRGSYTSSSVTSSSASSDHPSGSSNMATNTFGIRTRHELDGPPPSWVNDSQTTRPASMYRYHALTFDGRVSPPQGPIDVRALPPCPTLESSSPAYRSAIEPTHVGSKSDAQDLCDGLFPEGSIYHADVESEVPFHLGNDSHPSLGVYGVYNTELVDINLRYVSQRDQAIFALSYFQY